MSFSKIILARFNEDISWAINAYKEKCIIYNKGRNIHNDLATIIPRSNHPKHGRESETYLYHIISNYDQLDPYLIFSQGDPFQHSPNFIEIVNYLDKTNSWKNYQPLTMRWVPGHQVPPESFIEYDRSCYIDNKYPIYMEVIDDDMNQILYPDYGIYNTMFRFKRVHRLKVTDKILPYLIHELDLHNKIKTNFIKFNFGAIFGVRKENILQHPRSFYEKLYKFSLEDWSHGYFLERLWYSIFY